MLSEISGFTLFGPGIKTCLSSIRNKRTGPNNIGTSVYNLSPQPHKTQERLNGPGDVMQVLALSEQIEWRLHCR
jgi:hypothetical protein